MVDTEFGNISHLGCDWVFATGFSTKILLLLEQRELVDYN